MNLFSVCGMAILACTSAQILRRIHEPSSKLTSIVFIVIAGTTLIGASVPLIEFIKTLDMNESFEKYYSIMMKGLGLCILGTTAGDICRDSGEETISSVLSIATKISVMIVCLPLLNDIIELAKEMLLR